MFRFIALLAIGLCLGRYEVLSQSESNRFAIGFFAGVNQYYGEFENNYISPGGELFARYNILSTFSANLSYSVNLSQWNISSEQLNKYNGYFGEGVVFGNKFSGTEIEIPNKFNSYNSNIELTLSFNPFPYLKFVPTFFSGIGLIEYDPKTLGFDEGVKLPNNKDGIYENKSLYIPLGVGFEYYINDSFVLNGKVKFSYLFTDYFDDLSGSNGNVGRTDIRANSDNDYLVNVGLGLSYYIFGSPDYDNDGLSNSLEKKYGSNPNIPDTDGDGLKDGEEVHVYTTNPTKPDSDNDNLTDYDEIFTYKTSPVRFDSDKDGLGDGEEIARKTNPNLADSDIDGLNDGDEVNKYSTDPLKHDSDNDGLSDGEEVLKYLTNPKLKDTDKDGLADGSEVNKYKTNPALEDSDGDGLSDGEEIHNFKTDPLFPDTDQDGLTDGDEVNKFKTNPLLADTDSDGLNDGVEINIYNSNPLVEDTDGDKISDGEEVNRYKSNPVLVDSDSDGLSDYDEIFVYHTNPNKSDTDNDMLFDGKEINDTRTNPMDSDTDKDSIIDGLDACPLFAGTANLDTTKNGCPPLPDKGTKIIFNDIKFISDKDDFDFDNHSTIVGLTKLLDYISQCNGIQIRLESHYFGDLNSKRSQSLTQKRVNKVKTWLMEQGIGQSAINGAIGYGKSQPIKSLNSKNSSMSKEELEIIKNINDRICIEVIKECDR